MTKKTRSRLIKEGKVAPAKVKRNFSPAEVIELTAMNQLVNGEKFKAYMIKGNTALVPDGQKWAEHYDALARLFENAKNQWISIKLTECGYAPDTKCNVNLSTGEISVDAK